MILDTFICDALLKKGIEHRLVIFLMSIYYIILYSLLYFFVISKAFSPYNVQIPSIIVALFFLVYRIRSIKGYISSKV